MKDGFGYDILKLDYKIVVRKYRGSNCREGIIIVVVWVWCFMSIFYIWLGLFS